MKPQSDYPRLFWTLFSLGFIHFMVAASILESRNEILPHIPLLFVLTIALSMGLIPAIRFLQAMVYKNEPTEPLLGLPNVLTLYRLVSVPPLFFLFSPHISERLELTLVLYVASIMMSDFLDGQLSRRLHLGTRLGRYLDSSSDYILLGAVCIIFTQRGYLHPWLLAALLIRFGAQTVYSVIITARYKRAPQWHTSFMAKSSVAMTMVVSFLGILITEFNGAQWIQTVYWIALALCSFSLAWSLVEKTQVFIREMKGVGL